MKRFSFTKLTVACAFLFAPLAASAQIETATGRSAFVDKLVLELGVGAGTSHDDVRPMELFVNAGYRFIPRMYVFAHAGGMFGLGEKTGGTRAYTRTPLLGGGLGYTLCSGDGVALDVRGSAASSLGKADWKGVAYDAGLFLRVGSCGYKFNIGLGYRHFNSRSAGIGNYNGLYATLGIGL